MKILHRNNLFFLIVLFTLIVHSNSTMGQTDNKNKPKESNLTNRSKPKKTNKRPHIKNSDSQKSLHTEDARKFINIYEKNKKWQRLIYTWDDTLEYPTNPYTQMQKVVDPGSKIQIHFEIDSMVENNYGLRGDYSLIAMLNTNPIEVSPYSEIGQNYTTLSTSSYSANEIAIRVVRTEDILEKLNTSIEKIDFLKEFNQSQTNVINFRIFKSYIDWADSLNNGTKRIFLSRLGIDNTLYDKTIRPNFLALDSLLEKDINSIDSLNQEVFESTKYLIQLIKEKKDNEKEKLDSTVNVEKETELIKAHSKQIAEALFSELHFATIDLAKVNAKPGDKLYIKLIRKGSQIKDSNKNGTNTNNGLMYDVVTLYIRKTGFYGKISDSFLFINRIDQGGLANDTDASNSRFKASPGASFYLQYGARKKGYALNPSFGINVSFLDFSQERDLELGVGAVLGLFDNTLSATFGYNLHIKGSNNPWYFGFGFSFINSRDEIKALFAKP